MLNSIPNWQVGHTKRSENVTAHKWAKYELSITENHLWKNAYPFCIHEKVYGELVDFEDRRLSMDGSFFLAVVLSLFS